MYKSDVFLFQASGVLGNNIGVDLRYIGCACD